MWQLYQGAMAIVHACGIPDLLITLTCNPQWPEILSALLAGQMAQDRPDVVSRVFKLKLKAVIHDLTELNIFSKAVTHRKGVFLMHTSLLFLTEIATLI